MHAGTDKFQVYLIVRARLSAFIMGSSDCPIHQMTVLSFVKSYGSSPDEPAG